MAKGVSRSFNIVAILAFLLSGWKNCWLEVKLSIVPIISQRLKIVWLFCVFQAWILAPCLPYNGDLFDWIQGKPENWGGFSEVGGKFETSGSFNISVVRMIDGSCVEVSLSRYNFKRQFSIWGEVVLRLVWLPSPKGFLKNFSSRGVSSVLFSQGKHGTTYWTHALCE